MQQDEILELQSLKSRLTYNQLAFWPKTLKTLGGVACGVGVAFGVSWLTVFGILALLVAFYWLDFNLWRWLNGR